MNSVTMHAADMYTRFTIVMCVLLCGFDAIIYAIHLGWLKGAAWLLPLAFLRLWDRWETSR